MEEEIVFEDDDVKITNLRAIIGSKTYAIANVTSVGLSRIEPSTGLAFSLMLIGGMAAMFAIAAENWGLAGTFGFIAVLGGIVVAQSKPSFAVTINSASGETKALKSQDEGRIRRIVDAMNEAIVRRG